jgi:hypothetical protein
LFSSSACKRRLEFLKEDLKYFTPPPPPSSSSSSSSSFSNPNPPPSFNYCLHEVVINEENTGNGRCVDYIAKYRNDNSEKELLGELTIERIHRNIEEIIRRKAEEKILEKKCEMEQEDDEDDDDEKDEETVQKEDDDFMKFWYFNNTDVKNVSWVDLKVFFFFFFFFFLFYVFIFVIFCFHGVG